MEKSGQFRRYLVGLSGELQAFSIQNILYLNRSDDWLLNASTKKIIFSDEVHFLLAGFVNKQNCRIWTSEKPDVMHEKRLYPKKMTIWCGVIGLFVGATCHKACDTIELL